MRTNEQTLLTVGDLVSGGDCFPFLVDLGELSPLTNSDVLPALAEETRSGDAGAMVDLIDSTELAGLADFVDLAHLADLPLDVGAEAGAAAGAAPCVGATDDDVALFSFDPPALCDFGPPGLRALFAFESPALSAFASAVAGVRSSSRYGGPRATPASLSASVSAPTCSCGATSRSARQCHTSSSSAGPVAVVAEAAAARTMALTTWPSEAGFMVGREMVWRTSGW